MALRAILPYLPSIPYLFSTKHERLSPIPQLLAEDPDIQALKKEMTIRKVAVYWIDIFKKNRIDVCKVLFHPEADPLIIDRLYVMLNNAHTYYAHTLESYLVDKCFSTQINLNRFKDLLSCLSQFLLENHQKEKDRIDVEVESYFLHYEKYEGRQIAAHLMARVVKRLLFQEQEKVYKKIPPPSLGEESLKRLDQSIRAGKAQGKFLTDLLKIEDLIPEERPIYREYLKTLLIERNERVYAILDKAYRKDLCARRSNPQAPLTHLMTLESYEKEILQKRLQLVLKITAIAIGIFAFAKIAPYALARLR